MSQNQIGAILFLMLGCAPDYSVKGPATALSGDVTDANTDADDDNNGDPSDPDEDDGETDEDEDGEAEDYSLYEGAMIRIIEPESGAFLPYDEDNDFVAVIETPDGDEIEFDEIEWRSDADDEWTPTGADFTDDEIDVGRHNITAEVALPDGSRLAYTVGGVLVQHKDAGTYVGDMIISMDGSVGETPVGTSCVGAAFIIVDEYGELATGDSACTLDLLGYATFEVDHGFEYELDEEDLDGSAFVNIPFVGIPLPFGSEGSIEDGEIATSWEGGVGGFFELSGTLEATRITREVTEL